MRRLLVMVVAAVLPVAAAAETIDWNAVTREATGYLQEYVRLDTSNPPGDVSDAIAYLQRILSDAGVATQVFESAPGKRSLLARLPGGEAGKPILLLSHADVVPASAAQWKVPPFSGALQDGVVWGRGTLDDKGHGIAQLMTMLLLQRQHTPLRRGVSMLVTADEEIGGELGAKWMVEQHWDQLDPWLVINEGGSGIRGMLANDTPAFLVAVAEKQVLWLELTAAGEAGHGSQPTENNANDTLVRALNRVLDSPRPYRVGPVTAEMFRQLAPGLSFPASFITARLDSPLFFSLAKGRLLQNRQTRAMLHDTVSLTMLNAGYKANVIPSQATATIDCRLLPETQQSEFIEWLAARLDERRIAVRALQSSVPAPPSDFNGLFFDTVRAVMRDLRPDGLVAPVLTIGGTDSRFFRARGVNAYGFAPVILTTDDVNTLHGVDEHVSVDNVRFGVEATYRLVERLTSADSERAP
jgi:acetylornithine deacetylase/succinyl-diaminopimelate desuccinylase-like protein